MGIIKKEGKDLKQSWDRKKVFIGLKPLLDEKGYPGMKAPWDAKNGHLSLATGEMDYVRFGRGERVMVLLPGVGDGLKTVKGMALPFAYLYRGLADDFTVYVFSRRVSLPPKMTTRDMADDLNLAMEELGLSGCAVVGVSQGGMIAQWLAIDHPEKVDKLVLTVTLCRRNQTIQEVILGWMNMAKNGDYKGIMMDTAEKCYSEKRLRRERIVYRMLGNIGKPRSFKRFLIEARSCLTHNTYDELPRISCPTLVVGGWQDKIVTGEASVEIAERIPDSQLKMYDDLGHGLYEEAPDYIDLIKGFCL